MPKVVNSVKHDPRTGKIEVTFQDGSARQIEPFSTVRLANGKTKTAGQITCSDVLE